MMETHLPKSDPKDVVRGDDALSRTGPYQTTSAELGPRSTPVGIEPPSWPRPVTGSIGPYDLLEELALGGMGVIYKARHRDLGRIVALKTMRVVTMVDADHVLRFEREARAAARLSHPNIITMYEVDVFLGRPYYTMEFQAAGSLAQNRQRFAEPRAVAALVEKVARAVHYAHGEGVLHRDLKPSNILINSRGEPLVSDFGLARLAESDIELTRTGAVLGTPAYMAPEQAAGLNKEVGPAADVWALGVILFELLAGRRPFLGNDGDEIRHQILQADPPRLRFVLPDVDRSVETIVSKCLEKEPGRRYASAEALADDLGRWLRDEPIAARPEGLVRRLGRLRRRHPALLIGAGLVGILAILWTFAGDLVRPDPDHPLKEIERTLARGLPVTLLEDTGSPRWSQIGLGNAMLVEQPRPESAFSFGSHEGVSLLELVHDPRQPSFRFRAEVCHMAGGISSEVGIYFAHSQHPRQGTVDHCYCTVSFNDLEDLHDPPGADGHRTYVSLKMRRHDFARQFNQSLWGGGLKKYYRSARSTGPRGDFRWRQLAVELDAVDFRVFWEGICFGLVARDQLVKEAEQFTIVGPSERSPVIPAPEFHPRAPLGLFVQNAGALFRRVVIEPLK
jgi:serine/threonine-protein kinase